MFCAGPATEKLLFKYISEECYKNNKKFEDIIDIKFRDKSKYGWSSSMRIDYSDGTTNEIVDKSESTFINYFILVLQLRMPVTAVHMQGTSHMQTLG
jgi:hypothetical protein